MDLTGLDLKIHAVKGANARERLGDTGHGEQGWLWCHEDSPRRMRAVSGQGWAGLVRYVDGSGMPLASCALERRD
ncbi:hypothetical protein GCM10010344_63940 [Streptomyces bluensis]|nr:hypothetical protein GCM10010344_63940 [Streptomyces bluensis]